MANKTWKTNAGSGDISNAANWTPSKPGSQDTAVIPTGCATWPNSGTLQCLNVTLQTGGQIHGGTWGRADNGTCNISGTVYGGEFACATTNMAAGGTVNPADEANPPSFDGEVNVAAGANFRGICHKSLSFSGLTGGRALVSAELLDADAVYIMSVAPNVTAYMTTPGSILPGDVWNGKPTADNPSGKVSNEWYGTRIDCSQFHARKTGVGYFGDPDNLMDGKCVVPDKANVVKDIEVDYDETELTLIYSGGTVTPDLSLSQVTGGELVCLGNNIYATPGILSFIDTQAELDGQFDFSGLTAIQSISLSSLATTLSPITAGLATLTTFSMPNGHITAINVTGCTALESLDLSATPVATLAGIADCMAIQILNLGQTALTSLDVHGKTALQKLVLMQCPLGTTPNVNVTGCSALAWLDMADTGIATGIDLTGCTGLTMIGWDANALSNSDSIYIWAAANLPHDRADGEIYTNVGTNAAVTSASAAARTALAPPNGTWTLHVNT